MNSSCLIGVAEVDITPPAGVEMAGYGARQQPALGIRDRLKAYAVVFDDRGGKKSVICVADVCGINPVLVATVRRRAGSRIAVRPERMMIAATHTHSGPALGGASLANQQWTRELEDKLTQVIVEADLFRRDAWIGAAVGQVKGVGGNRRDPKHGVVDRSVNVVRVDDARSGKILAVIVNHACHATTLDAHNVEISADYPGQVRAYVKQQLKDQPAVLFLNGACGDINPGGYSAEDSALGKFIPNRTYERAQAIGKILGKEALRLVRAIRPAAAGAVSGGSFPVQLPLRMTALPAEAALEAKAARQALESATQRGITGVALERLRLELMYAQCSAHVAERRVTLPNGELTTEVQALGVGDIVFLGMPGEVFTEIGLDLKKTSPFAHTLLIGYANDGAGYFPTVKSLDQGGYEVRVSMFGDVAINRMQGWARLLLNGLRPSRECQTASRITSAADSLKRDPDWLQTGTVVAKAKFPAIDFHLHCLGSGYTAEATLKALKDAQVRYGVNLFGNRRMEADLAPVLWDRKKGKSRFLRFFGLDFNRLDDADWADYVRHKMDHDIKLGGRGLKIYKELGLEYRDRGGNLILPDDARLRPVWQAAAERHLPVLYHVADPLRNFVPLGGAYEELKAMDSVGLFRKFGAPGYPTHEELLQSMERLATANPRTTFVFAHLAAMDADLARCTRFLKAHPHVYVDTAARLNELGRQPYAARQFFLENADRVLWGTDFSIPNQNNGYQDWFRFFETRDEYFGHRHFGSPSPWGLYGVGLPDAVLRKIYGQNAARLLNVDL